MALDVFWVSGSPFSWRVLLALEYKGVTWQSHLLQLSKGENRTPEFLALNPRGQVPVLRDGAVVVSESVAILAYLERKVPDPPLFGRTAEEAARVWQAVMECALYLDGPADSLILPIYRGRTDVPDGVVRAAVARMHTELARWEGALAGGPWLALSTLSAADLALYPMLRSGLRAAEKPAAARFELGLLPIEARYPRLAAWMRAIEALPGYDKTYPPHWRDG